jgi:LysM repeat protein
MRKKRGRFTYNEIPTHVFSQFFAFAIVTFALIGLFQGAVSDGGLALVSEAKVDEKSELLSSLSTTRPQPKEQNPSSFLVNMAPTTKKPEAEAINQNKAKFYVVQAGDTLSTVALKNKINVPTLIKLNNIDTDINLVPGQELMVKEAVQPKLEPETQAKPK